VLAWGDPAIPGCGANAGVYWYRRDGDTNPTSFAQFEVASLSEGYDAAVGDVDNDGDLDVVSADRTADVVGFHENDGAESFAARAVTTWADEVSKVRLVDLDNDGDSDVLAASADDQSTGAPGGVEGERPRRASKRLLAGRVAREFLRDPRADGRSDDHQPPVGQPRADDGRADHHRAAVGDPRAHRHARPVDARAVAQANGDAEALAELLADAAPDVPLR